MIDRATPRSWSDLKDMLAAQRSSGGGHLRPGVPAASCADATAMSGENYGKLGRRTTPVAQAPLIDRPWWVKSYD